MMLDSRSSSTSMSSTGSSSPEAALPWHRHRRRQQPRRQGGAQRARLATTTLAILLAMTSTTTTTTAAATIQPLALHLLSPSVWNHSLPLNALLDGVSHPGGAAARARLAALARDLHGGGSSSSSSSTRPVRVVALGGSITCGHMVEKGVEDWFSLLTKQFLPRAFPDASGGGGGGAGNNTKNDRNRRRPRLRAHNGCIPATQSEMASLCLDRVLRGEDQRDDDDNGGVDLVLVEFSVNDGYAGSPSPDHSRARAFERLLRTVMRRGRRRRRRMQQEGPGRGQEAPSSSSSSPAPIPPAVVLLHLLPTDAHKLSTPYYASAETDYDVLARYYGLPSVSLRAALWHGLFAAQPGFSRGDVFPETEERHPTPLGHKYVADLVVWLLQRAVLEEELGLGAFAPAAAAAAGGGGLGVTEGFGLVPPPAPLLHPHLGPPMFAGNEESRAQACLLAEDLRGAVVFNRGFRWVNDAKTNATTAKWGYAADQVNATLVLRLDTRAHADGRGEEEDQAEEEERGRRRRRRRQLAATAVVDVVPAEGVADAEARGLMLAPPSRQLLQQQAKEQKKKEQTEKDHKKKEKKKAPLSSPRPPPPPPPPSSSSSSSFDPEDATIPAEETLPPESTPKDMFVWIGYVASWRAVGSAVVWCARHCRCDARVVDAWQASKTTQQVAVRVPATQSERCWVAVRVLNETSTGAHGFKVTGAMVGRRTEEGLFGDASEMTLMEAFNPGGGEGAVKEEEEEGEEAKGEGKGG